jgi:cardiolipin synthase A/B
VLKFAALARARGWLEAGIRLFEYRDAMMHSKYGVVDHDVCSVGTFNYNSTSVGLANEVNVLAFDRAFVEAAAARFEEDLSRCGEVTLRSLSRRGRVGRVLDAVANGLVAGADLAWGPR